jgi:hypothetical protein
LVIGATAITKWTAFVDIISVVWFHLIFLISM